MKLTFRGHDDRYAVEQSLLAFFPEERPVYEGEDGESHAEVTLREGDTYAVGVTVLTYGGKKARGEARVRVAGVSDEYERERLRQRALKLSFFRAAREVTGVTPSWGALTGIRPAKLVRGMMEEGMTAAQADRVLRETYCVSPARRRLALESAAAGLKAKNELRPEEISLYIGIPFCPTRCAYCSFVSASVEKSFKLMEPYLEALTAEIDAAGRMVRETGLRVKSFYMGGGTPTTLSARQMDALLTKVNESFDLSGCAEYCIEAGRPDTIDREKLQVLLDHGADRISVNPQSLEAQVLEAIGRHHSPEDIERAMELAVSMGFPHVNMDLIAGLPADTPEGFRRTLDRCMTFGADNITVHTLSLKKGSRILLEELPIPTAEDVAAMLDYADPALRARGFQPYYLYRQKYMSGSFENVGWTRPGFDGLYNIYMMEELHTVLSLGGGGMNKVNLPGGRIVRFHNPKYPKEYLAQLDDVLLEKEEIFRLLGKEDGNVH